MRALALAIITTIMLTSCGARTSLGDGNPPRTDAGEDAAGDVATLDGDGLDATQTRYCATIAGAVSSCDAGLQGGYVILCEAATTCRYFEGEWGCCRANFQSCSYGNDMSSCP